MSENDVQEIFSSKDSAAIIEVLTGAAFEVLERDDCGRHQLLGIAHGG